MIFNPAEHTVILERDILIALGEGERLGILSELAKRKGQDIFPLKNAFQQR